MNDNAPIGIVGAGVMGSGIAQMFAEHDRETLLWDTDPAVLQQGLSSIRNRLEKSAAKGHLTPARVEPILARLKPAATLADFAACGLVLEAVTEDKPAKQRLFAELEPLLAETATLATNTSSLSVTELAGTLQHPDRFLGLHFFNPPTKLELVEVVPTPQTSPVVLAKARELLTACGKTPVTVADSPGFIVNRLLMLLLNEAAHMVDEGVATPEDIDTAMRLGALHPAGPLAVADLIGLDTCQKVLTVLQEEFGFSPYEPAHSLTRRVAAGKLGRKSGQGFFTYDR